MTHDVAVIGAGATGCATAYFLKAAGVAKVCVIEPDPTYAKASTPVATGGCRRLFGLPENIRMSQFSIGFFKDFAAHVAVDGYAPDVQWRERGYLFVVGAGHEKVLEQNYRLERELGVNVELLDRSAIAERYPWMRNDDLALGGYRRKTAGSIPTACCRASARRRRRWARSSSATASWA